MQIVVCTRWVTLVPTEYVNRLFLGVMRNVARPTRFIAFVDEFPGLDAGIEARPIPPIRQDAAAKGVLADSRAGFDFPAEF